MTLYLEQECETNFPFDCENTARQVIEAALDAEQFPYEAELTLMLVTKEEIQNINRSYRQLDKPTDVLSFPLIAYTRPGDFSGIGEEADNFNPDTGEAMLGDIILCVPKIIEQAAEYGHSEKREFAFLILHSMLHLFGYDHETAGDAEIMEQKQTEILEKINIMRGVVSSKL